MTTITEPDFIRALAARGVPVNRSQVNQFRPVAEQRGDCKSHGTGKRCVWEWQASAADVWADYLRYRKAKIAERADGWNSKTPYRRHDVDWVVSVMQSAREAQQQQEAA